MLKAKHNYVCKLANTLPYKLLNVIDDLFFSFKKTKLF
jgi:hypothetical protein